MEISINVVVIISAAVLVLAVVAAFFSGQVYSGLNAIETESLYAKACSILRNNCNSDIDSVFADGHSLSELCLAKGIAYSADCAKICGCSTAYDYPLTTEKDRTTVSSSNFENIGVVTPT